MDAYFNKKIVVLYLPKNTKKLIEINHNKSIEKFTTFGVPVKARFFSSFSSVNQLINTLQNPEIKDEKLLVLGGGSNLLFTKDFEGLVLKNEISGIDKIKEDDSNVWLKVGAGENWHEFVMYCVENNFSGVENLSLIPGNVGASPMQNIGAYGVEIKDVFESLEALNIKTLKIEVFDNESCKFGYRESIFKNSHKGNYVILSVTYKLSKQPNFNVSYGAIEKQLKEMKVEELSIKAISDAVIVIRSSKLPDPKEIGNAGSFFKNPVVSRGKFEKLIVKFPEMAHYLQDNGKVKIAAGWLIDQLGWKGKTIGTYGVHKNQALVLVNYGGAKGKGTCGLVGDRCGSGCIRLV